MPEIKDLFAEKRKEIDKKVKGYQTVPVQTPIPKIKTEPIEQQQIEQEIEQQPITTKPPQKTEAPLSDYDIIRQRREEAIKEISAFEQHRQRLNELDKTTPVPKERYELKGDTPGEYGMYIGQKIEKEKEREKEQQRITQGIKEQGLEFMKQEKLKKQYEEQQKLKALQQNLNPDIDKKIKEYEEKQPSYFDQFSLIHKRAKNEDEQLHYDVVAELYDNDRRNYAIAKNVLQDTKSLLNAPTKTEGGGFGKAISNEIKQLDTWVTILGLADNLQKSSVVKFAQTGKPLTKSEESLLDAIFDYYYVSNERAGNISKAYAAGQIAGKSIPFMLDFVMTGGFASGATGGFGKAMAKRVEAKLIEKLGEATYKKLTKIGVDRLIKAPFKAAEELMAGAMQAPMTPTFYSSVTEEVMPKPIEKKEGGGYVYQQGTPIKDAIIRGMNEVIFERSGEFIGDVFSPLGNALAPINYFNKIKSTKLKNFNRVLYGGNGTFAETLKKTGFNGMSLEMGEEVFGQLANYVTGASTKEEMDEFFSKDNFQTMLMGFAPMTGISVAGNMAQRGMINYNHKKATANINNDFGDKAQDVISALNETSPDRLQDIFDEIMLNNDGYEGNKLTDKGKVMAKDMLRYVYTKAQVESVKGIDQDNYKATGAPKNAVNEMQDGKHTVALLDAQGNIIVQKQFENEDAAEKYKQKLNEMYMTPNNEVDKQINEGLNTLSQQTVTKLNTIKSNQKNANGEDIIITSVVEGLSNDALGVPNGTEVYIKADNGKQSIVQYVDNNELKKAVIPNENLTNKTEELVSDMFFQYMDIASKTIYKTSAQSNQLIMEGLAEEDNMTTHDYSNKKAGHKIKYDGKEAVIQSVDTDNDGNKYADIELEDGAIVKAVPLRSVKNPKTVTFNIGKQQIELSKSNETGYFQTDILSKEKAETVKNGIQINSDYIAEIKEQPNPANPIEKGYRVTVREKTEEEKQDKNAVLNAFIADVQANGLYVRDKEGGIQIINANEFDVNELTDKGELRITDKETGLPYVIPLENQQDLRAEYQQLQQQSDIERSKQPVETPTSKESLQVDIKAKKAEIEKKIIISGTDDGFTIIDSSNIKNENAGTDIDVRRRYSDEKYEIEYGIGDDKKSLFSDIHYGKKDSYHFFITDKKTGKRFYIVGISSRKIGVDADRNGSLFASIEDIGNIDNITRSLLELELIKQFEIQSKKRKDVFRPLPNDFINKVNAKYNAELAELNNQITPEQKQQQQPEKVELEVKPEEKPITEAKPEIKVPITEPTYTELFEQTRDQYGLDIALQDIRDEIISKSTQLSNINETIKSASMKEKAVLRGQAQAINIELTELNNILKTQEDAIKERNVEESNLAEYKGRDEGRETAETSRSDSYEQGRQEQAETQEIIEKTEKEKQSELKPTGEQLSLFSTTSLDQSLTDLSSEERVKIVQDAIEQINDGKKVIIIDDMFSHLETKFKDSKATLERINNLRKINGDVIGYTIGNEITLNSNQATINKCIAAFEHERQHVENKEDKAWNDIKNDIAENIDNETLQKEVSALSGNSFYEGLSNNVLADEYIAYVIQMTFEGKEIKSSLKYKNIIQDEYRKRNGERLSILGRGTYPNIDAERRIGQNIVDNETGENRFLGSVSEGQERERIISEAKESNTYLKAPNGNPTKTENIGTFDSENEDIRFSVVTNEQQRKLVDILNEISISEDVENAEESTNYRKAYIERYKALKDKLNAKNPNIVEIYQDVLKYLEALANDKTWSKWDKSAKPQLISIRNSVRELKKAGSIYGLKKKLEKALDIVLERQNETARKIIDNFVNQKLEGKKGKGVIIPKKVDAITRQFFDSMKEWMDKDSQSIENKLQNLRVAFNQKKEENERDIIESQIKALTYIQNYKENITKQEDTISNIIIDINRLSKEYILKDIRKDISSKHNTIASNKKKLDKVDERGKVDIIEANINLKKEIEAKQNEYKSIKQDIKLNKSDKAQLTLLKSLLLEKRISMQNSMESFIKELDTVLKEGIKAKRIFAAKEEAKKQEILKGVYLEFALSETAIIVNPPLEESKKSILHRWLDPKYTFSSMLKDFGIHAPDGRGILYERFFTNGMLVARQKELTGLKETTKAVDEKITGIFGKENHISQVQKLCNDFNGAYVTIKTTVNKLNTESGKTESSVQEQIMELRNGQALYIYAIAKMNDGIVKLNAMGIDQEQIDSVTATLDPKLIEFIDWAQDEYLPLLREKYNITHLDLFGSQLDQIDKYFPLNIDLSGIPKEIDIEDTKAFKGLPTTATGSILKRSYNHYSVDIQNSDAIEIFIDHIQTMEKWNAYAPVIKELNILNSDNTFKKYVNRYIFNGAANQFKDVCAIAVGAYVPQESTVGSILTTATKMYAISKISGRANTSLKQGLGMVQVLGEGNPEFTARVFKNFADPLCLKWCLDNLTLFEERWNGRTGGDDRLSLKGELSFIKSKKIVALMNKASNIGMLPNAAIDLFVSGVMAKSMYETKYNFYKERGYSEEESISKALKDAEIIYNETQQSAENLWLSKTQKDRTFLSASFSLFNNANFAYGRLFFEGLSTVGKQIKPKGRANLIAFQKARYIAEGRTPEVASKYAKNDVNRALSKGIMQIGLNGYFVQFVWNLASDIGIMKALQYIMVFMSDDDKEREIAFEELKDDIKYSAIKAVITPVRGLPGGKELESALELYLKGWNLKQISIQSNPLISDTKQAFEGMANGFKNNDWVKIINSLVRYASGFTGVDLNTIANIIYGIYDLIENHENITTTDVLYDLSLIINSPKSEQKFLAISRRDDDTFEDIVNRYIELKRVHQYGVFSPLTKKEDSRAEQDVAKMINVRYYTLKEMLNEYDKAVETYNKFNPDNYIDLYQNASYERASTLKAELGYSAKTEILDENQMNELKTAIEAMENDESLNEIYKKTKRSAWSTSRKKEPESE